MSEIHVPVLLNPVLQWLNLKKGAVIIDCTLGLGGHSIKILEKIGSEGFLIGFDKDKEALAKAIQNLKKYNKQILLVNKGFEEMEEVLKINKIDSVDGILLDLGLSSLQLDSKDRGFSYSKDALLDMRFDQGNEDKITAQEILNTYSAQDLTSIFRDYGEEKFAYKIANKIVEIRATKPLQTTDQLKEIIEQFYKIKINRRHPAKRIFQALRIEVNQELDALKTVLESSYKVLKTNGRLVVISYHSLEDRIVKNFLREKEADCICPKEALFCNCSKKEQIKILTSKPISPSEEEIAENPRSRSAKMRVGEKI